MAINQREAGSSWSNQHEGQSVQVKVKGRYMKNVCITGYVKHPGKIFIAGQRLAAKFRRKVKVLHFYHPLSWKGSDIVISLESAYKC